MEGEDAQFDSKHLKEEQALIDELKADTAAQEIFAVNFSYNNGELIRALFKRGEIMRGLKHSILCYTWTDPEELLQ
jgi:hypothetical protein